MKRYTAQEMREAAKDIEANLVMSPLSEMDDVTYRSIAMLRQSADDMEREEKREKKYEYGVIPHGVYFVYQTLAEAEHKQAVFEQAGFQYPIVRRSVGEWEEV